MSNSVGEMDVDGQLGNMEEEGQVEVELVEIEQARLSRIYGAGGSGWIRSRSGGRRRARGPATRTVGWVDARVGCRRSVWFNKSWIGTS